MPPPLLLPPPYRTRALSCFLRARSPLARGTSGFDSCGARDAMPGPICSGRTLHPLNIESMASCPLAYRIPLQAFALLSRTGGRFTVSADRLTRRAPAPSRCAAAEEAAEADAPRPRLFGKGKQKKGKWPAIQRPQSFVSPWSFPSTVPGFSHSYTTRADPTLHVCIALLDLHACMTRSC